MPCPQMCMIILINLHAKSTNNEITEKITWNNTRFYNIIQNSYSSTSISLMNLNYGEMPLTSKIDEFVNGAQPAQCFLYKSIKKTILDENWFSFLYAMIAMFGKLVTKSISS